MAITEAKTRRKTQSTKKELIAELAALRQELEALRQERDDLELLLETTTEHSDTVEEELHNKAEEVLHKSEQRLRMIVEATPVPVLISRVSDGRIVYANAMAGPFFGLSRAALLERRSMEFYHHPSERQALLEHLERHGEVNRREQRIKRADGTLRWVEVSLRRLIFDDAPSLLVALHDITERKQATEALQVAVDDLTQINQASSRFVPSAFLEFLHKESIVDIQLGDHVSKEMTVLFSDLRSFTTLSENMTPQENFDFINAYLRRVSPVVREHSGFIVKYLGDGLMAIFPERADDAVRAGIDKLQRVKEYNAYRQRIGRQPVQVGIGVNTGHMMVGVVGEATRIQGDAFSDNVNLTSRVEGLTKFYGISFIITAETYQRLSDPADYNIRFIGKVRVVGRTETLQLYEVFDGDAPDQRELKQQTQNDFTDALELYFAQEFAEAQAKLFGVLQRNPKDKVAWHHLVQATHALESGMAENWTGVTIMTEK